MRELELRDAARAAREAGAREAEFLQLAELVKHQRNKFVHLVHLAGQHAADRRLRRPPWSSLSAAAGPPSRAACACFSMNTHSSVALQGICK